MKKIILLLFLLSNSANAAKWECINRTLMECNTWRMYVPAGWVVSGDNSNSTQHSYAMTFVPDSNHEWKL